MSQDLAASSKRCAHLTLAGWSTVQVLDAIDALSAVRADDIDVAVLQLPVDDTIAMDLPNVLREVSPAAYMPVTILAENPAESQRCRFLDSGADDIMSSEISGAELAARVGVLLRFKDLHDQLAMSQSALQSALDRERKLLAKLRADNATLQMLATTDALTEVQNVRSFQSLLEHEFKSARRYGHSISLLMLDLDHFKQVNDSHGHPSGDLVLRELCDLLKRTVRESDVICRTGGEEFSIILPRADHRQAARLAERIRLAVRDHVFRVYGREVQLTVSIGWATFPRHAEITDPPMLVYFADHALLQAKDRGRDRVVSLDDIERSVRAGLRQQCLSGNSSP